VGFLSVADEFFYFDLLDYFTYPDDLKLYDAYSASVLSVIDEEIAYLDDMVDDELDDDTYDTDQDESHVWFNNAKLSDEIVI